MPIVIYQPSSDDEEWGGHEQSTPPSQDRASQLAILREHEDALASHQRRARAEIPLADERTLSIVFND